MRNTREIILFIVGNAHKNGQDYSRSPQIISNNVKIHVQSYKLLFILRKYPEGLKNVI